MQFESLRNLQNCGHFGKGLGLVLPDWNPLVEIVVNSMTSCVFKDYGGRFATPAIQLLKWGETAFVNVIDKVEYRLIIMRSS